MKKQLTPVLSRRHIALSLVTAIGLGCLPAISQAQAGKTTRVIVGFPAGGSSDALARLLVESMRSKFDGPLLVENKPGAAGRIAIEFLKGAEADGSVILITPNPMVTMYPHVYKKLSYDPIKDITPVAQVASYPLFISVGPAVPASVKTIRDFTQWVKTDPKNGFYGSPGSGSTPHFVGVMMGKSAGIPLTHSPYRGDAPAIQDLIAGQIPMSINVPAAQLPHIPSGRLRVLATTGAKRALELPDVPTMVESGFPDIKTSDWFGAFVSAKTPAPVIAKIQNALRDALSTKEVSEGFAKLGLGTSFVPSAEFAVRIKEETDRWAVIVKETGFTPED